MNEASQRRERLASSDLKATQDDLSTGLKKLSPLISHRQWQRPAESLGELPGEKSLFQLARPLTELFEIEHKSPNFTPKKALARCEPTSNLLCDSPFPEERSMPYSPFDVAGRGRHRMPLSDSPFK